MVVGSHFVRFHGSADYGGNRLANYKTGAGKPGGDYKEGMTDCTDWMYGLKSFCFFGLSPVPVIFISESLLMDYPQEFFSARSRRINDTGKRQV